MTSWRMAFRAGKNGDEMWPACQRLGVAAIQYGPVDDIDLAQYSKGEPTEAWSKLAPSQQSSLHRLLDMEVGDVIYVKKGSMIVGKGIVTGPYHFDKKNRIREPNGVYWQHQRPVDWMLGFPELPIRIGKQQVVTLVLLQGEDIKRIEDTVGACFAEESDIEGMRTEVVRFKSKRSRKLRDLAFTAAHGLCAVCQRDYSKLLGGRGVRVLQVHHRNQLSARDVPSVTKISDLDVVCANCHLLLHLNPKQTIRIDALRQMLQADGFFQ